MLPVSQAARLRGGLQRALGGLWCSTLRGLLGPLGLLGLLGLLYLLGLLGLLVSVAGNNVNIFSCDTLLASIV